MDDLSWILGLISHDECTNIYDYTLKMIYGESWRKTINCHDSPSYYVVWTLNLKRILSLCQSQHEVLTYRWNPKVVIHPYGLGHYW